MPLRRFPPPWSVKKFDACFVVRDANTTAVSTKRLSTASNRPKLSFDGDAKISEAVEVRGIAMASQHRDTPETVSGGAVITYVGPEAKNTAADIVDRAGNAILELINRAAHTTEADLHAAREIGENLADQLRTAQSRINELEANVRYYQDRTQRAEKWLNRISSEIQQSLIGADDSDDAPDDSDGARRMAERLQNQDKTEAMPRQREPSFLRRLSRN
jgi:hypothetical protein